MVESKVKIQSGLPGPSQDSFIFSKQRKADWIQKIREAKIFGDIGITCVDDNDLNTWRVTEKNLGQLFYLLSLGVHLFQIETIAAGLIADSDTQSVPFIVLCELLETEKGQDAKAKNTATTIPLQSRPTIREKDFTSPAALICSLLDDLKDYSKKKRSGGDTKNAARQAILFKKVDYCLEKINSKANLYKVDAEMGKQLLVGDQKNLIVSGAIAQAQQQVQPHFQDYALSQERSQRLGSQYKRRRHSMQIGTGWLNEYSTLNMQAQVRTFVEKSKNSTSRENSQSAGGDQELIASDDGHLTEPQFHLQNSLYSLQERTEQNLQIFDKAFALEFDIFKFADQLGRQHALPFLTMHQLVGLPSQPLIKLKFDQQRLVCFLNAIQRGYRSEVQYHNDLHGADVMQMCSWILTEGHLAQVAELDALDQSALLIAAACHDFDHDGLNNSYHVNAMSSRALRYHDLSVQENFHAAESLSLLLREQNNFLAPLSQDDVKTFRKRMVALILATDMTQHLQDLETVKRKIAQLEIAKASDNGRLFINKASNTKIFESQQQLMDVCMHASDVSPPCRDFSLASKWTYLLFEEFFQQGDLEQQMKLPVSFLCDRSTTNVAGSQPGFLSFVVIPLMSTLSQVLPPVEQLTIRAESNKQKWEAYQETTEDKRIYKTQDDENKSSENDSFKSDNDDLPEQQQSEAP